MLENRNVQAKDFLSNLNQQSEAILNRLRYAMCDWHTNIIAVIIVVLIENISIALQ